MIIFDTCILRSAGWGSGIELIRAISESEVETVAAPWVVIEELAGQQVVKYMKDHVAADQALSRLMRSTPWATVPTLGACDPEAVREHWRQRYVEVVDLIPTSEAVLRDAFIREAGALPPAKSIEVSNSKTIKTGARDVSVWLSAVEYARQNPDEKVYFVSANTKDFGDGTVYDFPMAEDLDGIEDRFVHLTALDQVVSLFTEPTEVSETKCRDVLTRDASLSSLGEQARALMTEQAALSGFEASVLRVDAALEASTIWASRWLSPPAATLHSIDNISGYKIGDSEWCIASCTFLLLGLTPGDFGAGIRSTACKWEARVLVALRGDRSPVILRSQSSRALSDSEMADAATAIQGMSQQAFRGRDVSIALDERIAEIVSRAVQPSVAGAQERLAEAVRQAVQPSVAGAQERLAEAVRQAVQPSVAGAQERLAEAVRQAVQSSVAGAQERLAEAVRQAVRAPTSSVAGEGQGLSAENSTIDESDAKRPEGD